MQEATPFAVFLQKLYDEQQRERHAVGHHVGKVEFGPTDIGEDAADDGHGVGKAVGAEENPRKADDDEGDSPVQQFAESAELAFADAYGFFYAEDNAVQRALCHESPVGAVPDAADKEGDEEVEIVACTPYAVAAQRNVEVVHEPCAERYVPPFPELADRGGEIGTVEVLHQAEPHDLGGTDGKERVAGEVAIDLKREQHGGDDERCAVIVLHIVEHHIHVDAAAVCHAEFQEIAPQHHPQSRHYAVVVHGVVFVAELWQQVFGPLDRTRHELWEERHEEGVGKEIAFGAQRAAIDINGIADGLKCVERDAYGQQYVEPRHLPCYAAGVEGLR